MDVVQHLAEVDDEFKVGSTEWISYCNARRAHLSLMSLVPRSLIGHQMCDSGSHHCPRYTGELPSHLCWAWLARYWEQAQGLINNREDPLPTLVQYLLRSSQEDTISSYHIIPATQQVNMVFPPVCHKKQYHEIWLN